MIGYAICGSFCTHKQTLDVLRYFVENNIELLPILSENAYSLSTRFGDARVFVDNVEKITGKKVIHTIEDSEPVGPNNNISAMIIAPCTGNTMAKLSLGITDTSVTMAAKAAMRNQKPLIIGLCTNDGLGANGINLGVMLNKKNVYFVPLYQDDVDKKPTSLICDMSLVYKTYELAMQGKQIQPVIF